MTGKAKAAKTPPPRASKKRRARSGAAWPTSVSPPDLDSIEKQMRAAVVALRAELRREPTATEVSRRLGFRDATRSLLVVRDVVPFRLTVKQELCLRAIAKLEAELGRSPSTREVSEAMGLAPSGSRFHINHLVKLGLVTPPEVRLVLSLTDAGRAYLPPT